MKSAKCLRLQGFRVSNCPDGLITHSVPVGWTGFDQNIKQGEDE